MTIFDGILLGLLQALGEFLPISSSAHLVLLPYFRGQDYQGLTMDVLLHAATLLAVLLYFAKDWYELTKHGILHPTSTKGSFLWKLALATLPAAIAGFLLDDWAESTFRSPVCIATCLILFAIGLFWADHKKPINTPQNAEYNLSCTTLFLIGCAQALAIMPGVSRSGITITAALLLGLSRANSARTSFLLSAPIIAGAVVLKITQLHLADITAPLIWGLVSAFLGALCVIGFLMKYIKNNSFNLFVYYRILLGLIIIGVYLLK